MPARERLLRSLAQGAVLIAACGSDGGGGGRIDAGKPSSSKIGDVETECAAFCDAQLAAACMHSAPLDVCNADCDVVGKLRAACEPKWNAYNHCFAQAKLRCDEHGDPVTVMATQCETAFEAYQRCLGTADAG